MSLKTLQLMFYNSVVFRAVANLRGEAVSITDEKDCVDFFADSVSLCATGYYQPTVPSNARDNCVFVPFTCRCLLFICNMEVCFLEKCPALLWPDPELLSE